MGWTVNFLNILVNHFLLYYSGNQIMENLKLYSYNMCDAIPRSPLSMHLFELINKKCIFIIKNNNHTIIFLWKMSSFNTTDFWPHIFILLLFVQYIILALQVLYTGRHSTETYKILQINCIVLPYKTH